MTVNTTTSAISYVGTGSMATYAYTWQIFSQNDLVVYTLVPSTGVLTQLTISGSNFTVAGVGVPTGGSITLSAGNLASGTVLFIASDPLEIQALLLSQGGAYNPADVMQSLDQLTRMMQATRRVANNALQIPVSESLIGLVTTLPPAALRASKIVGFDSSGNAIVLVPTNASSTAVTATGSTTARFLADWFADTVNVKAFGAVMDGSTDDLAAWNAAISHANGLGGGIVFMPPGTSFVSGTITMKPNVTIQGCGKQASIIKSSHTGDGIAIKSTINTGGIAVNTEVRDIYLWNTNASNTGGGYDDVAGTYVALHNVQVRGFLYGMIFDQSELVDVSRCDFEAQLSGGGGIWLVNGSEHTVGASPGFTNRIRIADTCQFNEGSSTYCIIDDGGGCHTIENNNFNAGLVSIRISGVDIAHIAGNEMEASAGVSVYISNLKLGGNTATAPNNLHFTANLFLPAAGQVCVNIILADSISFEDNSFDTNQANAITGGDLANTILLLNNKNGGSGTLTDTPATVSQMEWDGNGLQMNGIISVLRNNGLGASVGAALTMLGGNPKRIYIGQGTGYTLSLSNRNSSTDTDVFQFMDTGLVKAKANVSPGVSSTATAAGTTTLSIASNQVQIFTGSTTQTLLLPAAAGMGAGQCCRYTVINRSSGTVTVGPSALPGTDTFNAGASSFACTTNTVTDFWSDGSGVWYTK